MNANTDRYPAETLGEDDDDGTMPETVAELSGAVIGRRIVSADKTPDGLKLSLDNGRTVTMRNTADCCAYTELNEFLLHPASVDHAILGVGTTDGFETWHIFADFGDVMKLTVGWSCGNPFYYGYRFDIVVEDSEVER